LKNTLANHDYDQNNYKKLTLSQNDSVDEYSDQSELGLAWSYRKGAGIDSSIKWGPIMQRKATTFSSNFKIPKMTVTVPQADPGGAGPGPAAASQ
jgi:hypothetical protein